MEFYSDKLQALVEALARLPGIGKKTAERLAYHLLRAPTEEAVALARAIHEVKKSVRNCRTCFHITEDELCQFCTDDRRDRGLICVVEQPRDVYAIENSGNFSGLYHVLMGAFAPLEGVSPDDLTVDELMRRISDQAATPSPVREVILATNPNFEGDGTALYLAERLGAVSGLKVSRIARGVPSGSNLEHVSKTMVADALDGRRPVDV